MEFEFSEGGIRFSRELSDLDKFVISFIRILNSLKIRYVIVSGYVVILFGRSRATEDVDIFIEGMDKKSFAMFVSEIEGKGLWIVNSSSNEIAYEMLEEGDSIRIARINTAIPNIEIKTAKTPEDREQLENPIKAVINGHELLISPIESQIAFKFWLGSEKDIEDAVYLYEIFRENLDKALLLKKCKELNVSGTMMRYVNVR